jgi:hypothetical protein
VYKNNTKLPDRENDKKWQLEQEKWQLVVDNAT